MVFREILAVLANPLEEAGSFLFLNKLEFIVFRARAFSALKAGALFRVSARLKNSAHPLLGRLAVGVVRSERRKVGG